MSNIKLKTSKMKYVYHKGVTCNNDISHFQKRKKLSEDNFVIIILVILTTLSTGLVTFIGNIVYNEITSVYSKTLEEFPVPCGDLSLSPYDDSEIFNVKTNGLQTSIGDDGKYICSSPNLTKIVTMVAERQTRLRLAKGFDIPRYLSCGNETLAPQSGYLTVAFTEISRQQNVSGKDFDVKLHWKKDDAKIDPSILYNDGDITIPESRTYFIYTSVHFNLSCGYSEKIQPFERLRPYQLSVRLCRDIYGYEETLLGRSEVYNISSSNAVTSLTISSHLQLTKNDKIYVKVSKARRLVLDSMGNTFGLFPL